MNRDRMLSSPVPSLCEPTCAFGSREESAVAALCSPVEATTARIRSLLYRLSPVDAWEALAQHDLSILKMLLEDGCRLNESAFHEWCQGVAASSLAKIASALRERRERVWWSSAGEHPEEPVDNLYRLLSNDEDHPPVLFLRGDLAALQQPRVAIIGTRNATTAGREMARMLGRELSDRGISVVSGLALGIDAAAHAGALASNRAKPIGIVGSGLDVVYPPSNRRLWHEVAARGLLLSELPDHRGPTPSTFPARNRIIAQLAQVIVVVESGRTGGSLITVDRGLERGRPVLAVPGNPLIPSSAGTNELLRPGLLGAVVMPCLGVADILTLLDLEVVDDPQFCDARAEPSPVDFAVLGAMGFDDLSVGGLSARLACDTSGAPHGEPPPSMTLADVSLSLARLEEEGWVARIAGRWRRIGTQ